MKKGDLLNLMGNKPQPSKRKITHGQEERVKMTRLRITIAKRLKEAQDSAALLSTFNEVAMSSIIQMRKDYQGDFTKKYSGVKLGFMSFFVKASVVALKNFPAVNAEIEENNIIYIAAGHHATERYGVQALCKHLSSKFNLKHQFLEVENSIEKCFLFPVVFRTSLKNGSCGFEK